VETKHTALSVNFHVSEKLDRYGISRYHEDRDGKFLRTLATRNKSTLHHKPEYSNKNYWPLNGQTIPIEASSIDRIHQSRCT
jgi:hypothetical protein